MRAATRDTFTSFIDRWYRPERTVVGIGGNIGGGLAERLEELLGSVEPRETGTPDPVQIAANGAAVKVHTKQSDQAHIVLGSRSYPLGHPDRYVLQLLATVLGGGMSSRLFTEVRERRGLAYYVFGTNSSYTDAGSLYAQAGVDIQRIDDAVTTIAAELRRMAEEPVPADELEKARAFAKGRFVLGIESPHGTIMYGLRREVLLGQAEEPEAMLAGLDAVTAEDVQRVAQDVVHGAEARRDRPIRGSRAVRASSSPPDERPGSMTDERALLVRTAEIAVRYLDTLDTRPVRPDADYGGDARGARPSRARGRDRAARRRRGARRPRGARAHRDGLGPLLRLRHRRHAAVLPRGRLARLDLGPEHGPRPGDACHLGARGGDRTLGARAARPARRTPRSPS